MISALQNKLRTLTSGKGESLITALGGDDTPALRRKYAYRVTDTVKSAIKGNIQNDPVAKQYIPQKRELQILPQERLDPIGDDVHSPVKGIIHRYPDRVLLAPANACAVYCRYCFRREKVGQRGEALPDILSDTEIQTALKYIRNHKEIWEVILTGGDPLILSAKQLGKIMQALAKIKHVKVIRLHTRVPIADPTRIKPQTIKALIANAGGKALYMALHINHVQELTKDVRACIATLHKAGINLLSQSVLLKGVNDNAETLAGLYRELVALNVKPYYLHHPDLAPGTSHFRLTIEEGQNIVQALRGKISGLCQPTYMLDIPGGYGKIPLTPNTAAQSSDGTYTLTDYQGGQHAYPPEIKAKP